MSVTIKVGIKKVQLNNNKNDDESIEYYYEYHMIDIYQDGKRFPGSRPGHRRRKQQQQQQQQQDGILPNHSLLSSTTTTTTTTTENPSVLQTNKNHETKKQSLSLLSIPQIKEEEEEEDESQTNENHETKKKQSSLLSVSKIKEEDDDDDTIIPNPLSLKPIQNIRKSSQSNVTESNLLLSEMDTNTIQDSTFNHYNPSHTTSINSTTTTTTTAIKKEIMDDTQTNALDILTKKKKKKNSVSKRKNNIMTKPKEPRKKKKGSSTTTITTNSINQDETTTIILNKNSIIPKKEDCETKQTKSFPSKRKNKTTKKVVSTTTTTTVDASMSSESNNHDNGMIDTPTTNHTKVDTDYTLLSTNWSENTTTVRVSVKKPPPIKKKKLPTNPKNNSSKRTKKSNDNNTIPNSIQKPPEEEQNEPLQESLFLNNQNNHSDTPTMMCSVITPTATTAAGNVDQQEENEAMGLLENDAIMTHQQQQNQEMKYENYYTMMEKPSDMTWGLESYSDIPPLPTDFPMTSSSCQWSIADEENRVILAKFITNTIHPDDERYFYQLMQRDDLTLISEGLLPPQSLNPKIWNLDYIASSTNYEYYHKYRLFHKNEMDHPSSSINKQSQYIEQDQFISMKMSDYVTYLKLRCSILSKQQQQQSNENDDGKAHPMESLDCITNSVENNHNMQQSLESMEDETCYFSYLDNDGKEKHVHVLNDVLYLIDCDMAKLLPSLDDDFKRHFRLPGILPGGTHCMMNKVNAGGRPFMGPNLYITPPASFTHFHQDGHGTVDSGHYCLSGFNEVVILRRLPELRKKHALYLLNQIDRHPYEHPLAYDALYGLPHENGRGEKPPWPDIQAIQNCQQMNYCPSVFILKPGQFVHINKGRLHAFRKLSPTTILDPSDCHAIQRKQLLFKNTNLSSKNPENFLCISVAWDWMYKGFTNNGIHREISSIIECATLNRKNASQSLAIPETCLLQMAKKFLAEYEYEQNQKESSQQKQQPLFAMIQNHNTFFHGKKVEPDTKTVLEGIWPSLNSLIKQHVTCYSVVDGGTKPKIKINSKPNTWENPESFSLDPYGNSDFFCKICSQELSNIYMHCDGCEEILNKDFNICLNCHKELRYERFVQMHPLNHSKHSTINHTGHYTYSRQSRCPCKKGPVCKKCHYCAGCSCRCHKNFTLHYRFMNISDEHKLCERVGNVVSSNESVETKTVDQSAPPIENVAQSTPMNGPNHHDVHTDTNGNDNEKKEKIQMSRFAVHDGNFTDHGTSILPFNETKKFRSEEKKSNMTAELSSNDSTILNNIDDHMESEKQEAYLKSKFNEKDTQPIVSTHTFLESAETQNHLSSNKFDSNLKRVSILNDSTFGDNLDKTVDNEVDTVEKIDEVCQKRKNGSKNIGIDSTREIFYEIPLKQHTQLYSNSQMIDQPINMSSTASHPCDHKTLRKEANGSGDAVNQVVNNLGGKVLHSTNQKKMTPEHKSTGQCSSFDENFHNKENLKTIKHNTTDMSQKETSIQNDCQVGVGRSEEEVTPEPIIKLSNIEFSNEGTSIDDDSSINIGSKEQMSKKNQKESNLHFEAPCAHYQEMRNIGNSSTSIWEKYYDHNLGSEITVNGKILTPTQLFNFVKRSTSCEPSEPLFLKSTYAVTCGESPSDYNIIRHLYKNFADIKRPPHDLGGGKLKFSTSEYNILVYHSHVKPIQKNLMPYRNNLESVLDTLVKQTFDQDFIENLKQTVENETQFEIMTESCSIMPSLSKWDKALHG